MTAHLTLPYNWMDCIDPETCDGQIHLPDTAEKLNNYPQEWTRALLPAECLDAEGTVTLYDSEGNTHNTHGAAKEQVNGTLEWYIHGLRHRDDGPAIEWTEGTAQWWFNGERHRDNGPAVIYDNGTEEWWQNGKLHRFNGPAVTHPDGAIYWYLNGEQQEGAAYWFLNGKQ